MIIRRRKKQLIQKSVFNPTKLVEPHKIFGRLGNSLFQYATLIALAADTKSDVYFQDTKWFGKYEKEIQQMFGAGIGSRPEVAIHVRRGDYVELSDRYPDLSRTDYYTRAIALFPEDDFLVFSDDIPYAKTLFQGPKFCFSEGLSPVQDLNQMASCKHQIIANSSYSWWGAYLNKNPNKIVVCPRQELWGSKISLPDSWKQL
jgi:hypothetical protein